MATHIKNDAQQRARPNLGTPNQATDLEDSLITQSVQNAVQNPNPQHLTPGVVLQLQRLIGNRAVQRIISKPPTITTTTAPSNVIQLGREATYGNVTIKIYSEDDAPDNSVNVRSKMSATKAGDASAGDKIKMITALIEAAIEVRDGSLVVNCKAGRERSATVAGVVFMLAGASADEALLALTSAAEVEPGEGQELYLDSFVQGWLYLLQEYKGKLPKKGRLGQDAYDKFTTAMGKFNPG